MKNFLSIILLLIILAGCDRADGGVSRLEAFRDRYTITHRYAGTTAREESRTDTVIYMTALEFPEGYDWRRDTSYGEVSGSIVLYRDSVRILEIPAGPGSLASLDPDLHHLVAGHVYTESCTTDETVIGLDGERLFSYPGRELLCGLLAGGGEVYTLGRNRSGSGFSLRRNGEVLFSRPEGSVSAHFSARPEYPSGALYRDGGHLYFSYWQPAGDGRDWYVVEDGTESRIEVPDERMYDIRIRDGIPEITPIKTSSLGVYHYSDGSWKAVVTVSREGRLVLYSPLWPTSRSVGQPVLFVSFRDACVFGHHLYIAMNPLAEGSRPYVWLDDKVLFGLDLNGFITEISVVAEKFGIAEDFH